MAGPYHASREWYYLLTELVRHIGRDNFHELLAQCLQSVSGYDSTFIVEFHRQQRPIRIYDNLVREFREVTSDPYVHGAYLLDPFYALFCNGARSGQFRLKEIAPEGFFQSEYYRKFYFETQLKDETGLFIPVDDDAVIFISLGLRVTSRPLRKHRRNRLSGVSPLLTELTIKHRQVFNSDVNESADTIGRSLDSAFRNFGRDHLSERECEIVRLVLKGYSSKAIAHLLEISPETVKVHRKRVHGKLAICSQAELFSLFLEALSMVHFGIEEDPLTLYFSNT